MGRGKVKVDLGEKTVEFKDLWMVTKKMALAFESGVWDDAFAKERKRYNKERVVLEYLARNRWQGAISAIWKHYKDKLKIIEDLGGGETMYFLD